MTPVQAPAARGHPPRRQRGVVLFVALIAAVALMLAGIALIRSVDTASVIAGNFAFRTASAEASDLGVEAAVAALPTIVASYRDSNITTPYYYFATLTPQYGGVPWDANGLPQVNWSNVPAVSTSGGYTVKYVIERLCTGALPVTDVQADCEASIAQSNGSMKAGAIRFTGGFAVYYRVTVYVAGPRNTASYVQTILSD